MLTHTHTHTHTHNLQLAELHDTERNYVKVLQTVVSVFKGTLSSQPKIITKVLHIFLIFFIYVFCFCFFFLFCLSLSTHTTSLPGGLRHDLLQHRGRAVRPPEVPGGAGSLAVVAHGPHCQRLLLECCELRVTHTHTHTHTISLFFTCFVNIHPSSSAIRCTYSGATDSSAVKSRTPLARYAAESPLFFSFLYPLTHTHTHTYTHIHTHTAA